MLHVIDQSGVDATWRRCRVVLMQDSVDVGQY